MDTKQSRRQEQGRNGFEETFSNVLSPKKNKTPKKIRTREMMKHSPVMADDESPRNASEVKVDVPFWERGMEKTNTFNPEERKELFSAIRKWNLMKSRESIQKQVPKKKKLKIIKHSH